MRGAGELLERLPHESPLHVGRDAARALVDRHDATRMELYLFRLPVPASRFPAVVILYDLKLRIRNLQPARAPHLNLAKQHDALLRLDHVLEERLVRPHRLDLAARILHQR